MMHWIPKAAAILVVPAILATTACGAGKPDALDAHRQRQVVAQLNRLLADRYVIPETAREIAEVLEQRLADGEFATFVTRAAFAEELTRILQDISHDRHLRVSPEGGAGGSEGGPVRIHVGRPGGGAVPAGLDQMDAFPSARMLAGNVGYVEITLFSAFPGAREKAAERMATVAGADALIFDLRGCVGGFPEMVHFITSYLYDAKPRHLLTYYHAYSPPDSAYTLAEIPGERMPNADVYILTSPLTASGGEEFSYVLKHHGRATIVGGTTAGAGHGGGMHSLPDGLEIFVPDFRPVHPVTGEGWEGLGVIPQIEVSPRQALDTAHREALRRKLERGVSDAERAVLVTQMARLENVLAARDVNVDRYDDYVGKFDVREVTRGETALYLQRQGGPRLELVPGEQDDLFHPDMMPQGAVRFVRDAAGRVVAVEARYPGSSEWMRSWRDGVNATP